MKLNMFNIEKYADKIIFILFISLFIFYLNFIHDDNRVGLHYLRLD